MNTEFHLFREPFDPDGEQTDFTFLLNLNPGESLVSALVEPVDATSTTPDPDTGLEIISTSVGEYTGPIANSVLSLVGSSTPNLWGVTIWVRGPVTVPMLYLRCAYETDSSPTHRKGHHTMRLMVKNR